MVFFRRLRSVFLFSELNVLAERVFVSVCGVGEVLFERSLRARRIIVSVRPGRGVRVAVPRRVSFKAARKFFDSNIAWTKKSIAQMQLREKNRIAAIEKLGEVDLSEAKQFLVRRVGELARLHGFEYGRVTIRRQKTRWGSCSAENNISLNSGLMLLSERTRDYVIVHELVHTIHKNHGKRFWRKVEKIMGDIKDIRRELHGHLL